jgi:hypothetical protein
MEQPAPLGVIYLELKFFFCTRKNKRSDRTPRVTGRRGLLGPGFLCPTCDELVFDLRLKTFLRQRPVAKAKAKVLEK